MVEAEALCNESERKREAGEGATAHSCYNTSDVKSNYNWINKYTMMTVLYEL